MTHKAWRIPGKKKKIVRMRLRITSKSQVSFLRKTAKGGMKMAKMTKITLLSIAIFPQIAPEPKIANCWKTEMQDKHCLVATTGNSGFNR